MAEVAAAAETPPWWAAFPAPKAKSPEIEADAVMELLEAQAAAGNDSPRDFLLVDVRRNDFEGGTIATSINFPAQSLYQTRPIIHQLCKQAGIKRVIFYCGESRRLSFDCLSKRSRRSLLKPPRKQQRAWPTVCELATRLL